MVDLYLPCPIFFVDFEFAGNIEVEADNEEDAKEFVMKGGGNYVFKNNL